MHEPQARHRYIAESQAIARGWMVMAMGSHVNRTEECDNRTKELSLSRRFRQQSRRSQPRNRPSVAAVHSTARNCGNWVGSCKAAFSSRNKEADIRDTGPFGVNEMLGIRLRKDRKRVNKFRIASIDYGRAREGAN